MATAKKLPSGNWRVNQYIGKDLSGKRSYKSFTADTKKEAEYMAAEYLMTHRTKPEDKTFLEAIQDYINSKDNTLSVSTIRGYHIIMNNAIDDIKNIKLCDINEITLQKWTNNNAKKYSAKSIRNQFGLVTAVIKQNKLNIDTGSILLKAKQKKEMVIPNKKQMSKILEMVSGTPIELAVTIALVLGLRQSEIAAIDWSDYDGKHLSINKSKVLDKNNKLVEKKTNKSYAGTRKLDVPDILKHRLDSAKQQSGKISTYAPSRVLINFQRLCKLNDLPRFTMHSLRHANASLLLQQGVPDKYAMERLGQSTTSMLKSVYQHTFKSEQTKISSKLNDCFSDIANKNDN